MPALFSARLVLLVGETLPLQRFFLPASRTACLHSGVRPLSQIEPQHALLTPLSIGLNNENDTRKNNKANKLKQSGSSSISSKSRAKTIRINDIKAVGATKKQQIESAPFAAKSFSELGLPHLLLERLENEGFTVPTEVQSAAIPTILNNHDVIIQSYTGSGKTLAYLLPILSNVGPLRNKTSESNSDGEPGRKMGIEAVVVAPSRELGMQIVREFEKILGLANKKAVQQLVGGANRSRQEEALKKNKPAIVVGTPGRIAELSAAGKLHTHGCRYLVLDEVDELLSFNFREDLHRILEHVGRRSGADPRAQNSTVPRRSERQTIMVSATVPFSVVRAARSWGHEPLLVQANKVGLLETISPSKPVNLSGSAPSSNSNSTTLTQAAESLPPALKHYYCVTKLQHKVDTLRRCIHALDAKFVIAFMNQIKQLKDVVFKLEARGMKAAELHGDLGKLARSTTLKKFKNGEVRVLVTNELSARGLDVAECDLVVNLDLPTDSIHYAHRAGRTGRLGRSGTVLSICEEPEVFVVKKLQKQLGMPIACCDFVEGKLLVKEEEKMLNAMR
ncbi:DEAD-box ATP-dependent RNA helicase 47, mitochondrial [Prosopis cineraria]|uniref:DEAD-box ATP-dependent RNA helicase 47, mitochondrial n=1 Tax=Prosopis cineraria TaxID=364024 RepID=UPI00240F3332|nr:DEAD-box ATP-dependent RNA helicase 47, mitochondrial [Prosopis cineraria]XP_054811118.1 DEAD-box ATP-dependent RNA helicase 47, mitochondrial [Prosopis cineraria]